MPTLTRISSKNFGRGGGSRRGQRRSYGRSASARRAPTGRQLPRHPIVVATPVTRRPLRSLVDKTPVFPAWSPFPAVGHARGGNDAPRVGVLPCCAAWHPW